MIKLHAWFQCDLGAVCSASSYDTLTRLRRFFLASSQQILQVVNPQIKIRRQRTLQDPDQIALLYLLQIWVIAGGYRVGVIFRREIISLMKKFSEIDFY